MPGAAGLLVALVVGTCSAFPTWGADQPPAAAAAGPAEIIVVQVRLNSIPQGDLFVGRAASGDFLVRLEDLRKMGVDPSSAATAVLEGEAYGSLRSMPDLSFALDERTLTLDITASPKLLPRQSISLESRRSRGAAAAPGNSAFFNYSLNSAYAGPTSGTRWGFAGEAGWRVGRFLLHTDATTVWNADGERKPVRLMSSVTHDDLANLRQTTLGDFFTASRDLGSSLNLGGISVSKAYGLDPSFVRFPMQTISGNASLPSQLEVYLDGRRIRTEQVRPGEFQLQDIVAYGGAQSVDVVLRDPFGRVQQLNYSFYFSDQPLQPGLHEYSYSAGAFRRRYGLASNSYGPAAFSAFHRYGLNRFVTIGLRAEGTRRLKRFGPVVTAVLGTAGVANLAVVGSTIGGQRGAATLLSYSYQARPWNFGASVRHDGRGHAALGDPPLVTNRRYEGALALGYQLPWHATLTLNHSALTVRGGVDPATTPPEAPFRVSVLAPRRITSVAYTAPLLSGRLSFSASLAHVKDQARGSRNEAFLGFTLLLDRDHSVAGSVRRDNDSHGESIRLVKSQPLGEGLGYAIGADQSVDNGSRGTQWNASAQYNAPAAVVRAEYNRSRVQEQVLDTHSFTLAGSVSLAGGASAVGRPVSGSFGIAKVGDLADVQVLVAGQPAGRTGSRGTVFLPTLSAYLENEVSVVAATVPIDYSLEALTRKVVPPAQGGVLIDFGARKIRAFTGRLGIRQAGAVTPAEFRELTLEIGGRPISLQTGRGGEFYLEDIEPGVYFGTLDVDGTPCKFEIRIPGTDQMLVELPPVTCAPGS